MAEVRSEMVSFASEGGGSCAGFLARPDDDKPYPGVVVLQEWWGLVDHIKEVTERFAAEGYIALAPDLYHGESTEDPVEARRLMERLDEAQAARDTVGAVDYLGDLSKTRIGLIGFCLGGTITFLAAAGSSAVGAAVPIYPTSAPEDVLRLINAPVLALYAEHDPIVPPAQAELVEEVLRGRAASVETHVYPGVEHAFFNDVDPRYNRPAAEDVWNRTLALFRKHLV